MKHRPSHMFVLCLLPLAGGCAQRTSDEGETTDAPIRLVNEIDDNTRIIIQATPPKPAVAVPIALTLTVEAARQQEIAIPDPSAQLDAMNVQSITAENRIIDGDRHSVSRTIVADASRPGPLEIGPFTATIDGRELTSDVLSLHVQSTLTEPFDAQTFADIPAPVAIEKPRDWTMAWVVGVVGLLALATLWLLLKRTAAIPKHRPVPPAHVLALRELEALLRSNLIEQGRLQEFYFRLSGLVRVYIEMRFGLMAPERTTQEFLAEAQRSNALRLSHKDLLRGFLVACDMVKYARYEPPGSETESAIVAARSFIEQTAAREPHTHDHHHPKGRADSQEEAHQIAEQPEHAPKPREVVT